MYTLILMILMNVTYKYKSIIVRCQLEIALIYMKSLREINHLCLITSMLVSTFSHYINITRFKLKYTE